MYFRVNRHKLNRTYRIVFCLDASFHKQLPHVFDKCLHIRPELFVILLCIQSQIVANLRTQLLQYAGLFILLSK